MGAAQDWSIIETALEKELVDRKSIIQANNVAGKFLPIARATTEWVNTMKNAEAAGGLLPAVAEEIAVQRESLLNAAKLENQMVFTAENSFKQAAAIPSLRLENLAEWTEIKIGLKTSIVESEKHFLANNSALSKEQYRTAGNELVDWVSRMEQAEASGSVTAEMHAALAEERAGLTQALTSGKNMLTNVDASVARAATFNHAPLESLLPTIEKQVVAETAAASAGLLRGLAGPVGYAVLLPEVALLVKTQYDKWTAQPDSPAVQEQQNYVSEHGISHANDVQR